MVGGKELLAAGERRALAAKMSLEDAIAAMSPEERTAIAVEAMRPDVREAFLSAQKRRPATFTVFRSSDVTNQRVPVTQKVEQSMQHSPEIERGRSAALRMAAPLDAEERRVCAMLGLNEEAFRAQRNAEIAQELHVNPCGLDDEDMTVCNLLGLTPQAYAAEKARGARR